MRKLVISAVCMLSLNVFAETVQVDVKGMTCGMCVKAITSELNATKKCENVNVSLDDKKATFETKKDTKISDDEIKAAIKKAGYTAEKITRS